ncbi:hypothetical protein PROFUN_16523 [Planoprotostelium fungivorum]|uniref:Uncharacterized protein n=1 Tax=Planoprotostelium fungivorum TaxID=1890364 RepID=A0A2P6MPZ2_9EUKA|nr:hypothetical protein PROFUN_16523 [Planoprotostelium fungivorum]
MTTHRTVNLERSLDRLKMVTRGDASLASDEVANMLESISQIQLDGIGSLDVLLNGLYMEKNE